MSHTTEIKGIVISDASALRAAIQELKSQGIRCDLLENAKPRAYYKEQGGLGQAPFVVKLHDSKYDVGLYAKTEGKGFEARTDFWNGEVEKVLGAKARKGEDETQAKLGKLFQAYAVAATVRQASQQGYTVSKQYKQDGSVQLRVAV